MELGNARKDVLVIIIRSELADYNKRSNERLMGRRYHTYQKIVLSSRPAVLDAPSYHLPASVCNIMSFQCSRCVKTTYTPSEDRTNHSRALCDSGFDLLKSVTRVLPPQ